MTFIVSLIGLMASAWIIIEKKRKEDKSSIYLAGEIMLSYILIVVLSVAIVKIADEIMKRRAASKGIDLGLQGSLGMDETDT